MLTPDEHKAMKQTAELWNTLCGIVEYGPSRRDDLRELMAHIHALQRAILSQSAGREYPYDYRLLGSDLVEEVTSDRTETPSKESAGPAG